MTEPTRRIASTDELCRLMHIPFSDQQLAAITAPLEPLVIVAGAGSGKTAVMAARVVWLVGTGVVRADQVLGLTFTNKAAAELGQRIRDYLGMAGLIRVPGTPADDENDQLAEPTVSTYHSYAARLLTDYGLWIGHEPDTQVLTDASRFQLAERAARRYPRAVEHLTTSLSHVVRYLLTLDAQLSEHLVSVADVVAWQDVERPWWQEAKPTKDVLEVLTKFEARTELLGLVENYRALKSEVGVMDFSDQMALVARLAEIHPQVGVAERDLFRIVLLDEYQDTSIAQARLLRALFSGAGDDDGRGHPVTAVGDPCQAIYGWRGASVSNIAAFPVQFPPSTASARSAARQLPLSVNRRSLVSILDTANALAKPLYDVHTGVEPLRPREGAKAGQVRAAVLEKFDDELAFLAREVPKAHAALARPRWADIGILVRDNKSAAAVHDALVYADVPVEVVGLNGLLAMPEIAEVLATLEVLHDVTANASLLQILTGPRWSIGPRDLALLGSRATAVARTSGPQADSLGEALEEAVAGVDPSEVVSLLEALQSPGAGGYSPQARERFAELADELRGLQRYIGEPLLDLVRRVIDTTGIDVELASSNTKVASARRDNLSTFLDAVASFAGIDGDASLSGLLAYLRAEEDYGQGLSLAVPTEADSVKLLTVHKAKGLEWEVVFVPGLTKSVFPSGQHRSRWTSAAQELPWPLRGDSADLPTVDAYSRQGVLDYASACRAHERREELRLAYVAVTRPRSLLVVSGYWWGPEQKAKRGPSEFMDAVIAAMADRGDSPEEYFPEPPDGAVNPSNRKLFAHPWPVDLEGPELQRRREAASLVDLARQVGWQRAAAEADETLLLVDAAEVQEWDLGLDQLIDEARSSRATEVVVPLPATLSATTLTRLQDDPDALARELARPMPRRPSPAARFGTRFHAWVEAHVGQQGLLDPDELPGRADEGIEGDDDLRLFTEAFARGPYGARVPHQVEAPFSVVLAGQVVRGRIDAVYETPEGGFEVVDWKTNKAKTADPLQLAVYRLAWSELTGQPLDRVQASFYYVRTGEVVTHDDLPDRAGLETLVLGPSPAD